MAIKTWLLGGVITDDHITPEIKSCWERKDLVEAPPMISYSKRFFADGSACVFANNMGCKVVLLPYGEFASQEAMEEDYYNEGELYTRAYQTGTTAVGKYSGKTLKDLDWVMPVMEGPLVIEQNYCYISNMSGENKELVSLIDCSMIYSSVKMISSFLSDMCGKSNLSKYEQYQLSYYQSMLHTIEKPECFMVNKMEIQIVSHFYETWGIANTIEVATSNAKQAVMLFSFLSGYQSNYNNELFSNFLTFFGIVVGFEAIYNIATIMIGGQSWVFDTIFSVVIILILSVYMVVFIKKYLSRSRENREFRKKTAAQPVQPAEFEDGT